MSPEERIARLVEEVRGDLARIGPLVAETMSLAPRLTPEVESVFRVGVAGHLHGFYTGCEALLVRIARASDRLPRGADWHKALLIGSAAGIDAVRPPVLSLDTTTALMRFLEFRHFFRAAYGVTLDVDKLREHLDALLPAWKAFRADIEKFLALLESA